MCNYCLEGEILKKRINGMISAIPTVFTEGGREVDEEAMREIIQFNVDAGINGIMLCGGTGELPNLSFEERLKVFSLSVDQVNGRIPVICTTGYPDTKRTIEMTESAADVGVDFVMIPKPYGGTIPNLDGIYDHYFTVAQKVDIPIICYIAPITSFLDTALLLWQGRSGVISAEILEKLADLDNIAGYKDTSCNLFLLQETIKLASDKISILAGTDRIVFPSLVIGCNGSIIASACIAPKEYTELFDAVQKNDVEKARRLHYKLLSIATLIELLPNFPESVKYALELLGYRAGHVRKPCLPLTPQEKKQVEDAMKEAGLQIIT